MPKRERFDVVVRRDEKCVDDAVRGEHDVLFRARLEHLFYSFYKPSFRLICALQAENPLVRPAEKGSDRSLKISPIAEVRDAAAVVLVQVGRSVARQTEHVSDDITRLGSFGFFAGDDYSWVTWAEPLGQKQALRSSLFTQKPVIGRHARSDVGQCVFDEQKSGHR